MDVFAHMAPRDAATIAALAQASETSISKVAQTLIGAAMGRRGWREVSERELERESRLRMARDGIDDETIDALIPGLPRNGPRSTVKTSLEHEDFELLCSLDMSRSHAARSLMEEALAHLVDGDDNPVAAPDEAARAAEAIASIRDPELRRSLVDTIERMAALCSASVPQ